MGLGAPRATWFGTRFGTAFSFDRLLAFLNFMKCPPNTVFNEG